MHKTKTSVISGLHRSGTTYVGRVLSLAKATAIIHEPYNHTWGLEYAPSTYTYWQADNPSIEADNIVLKTLAFKGNFTKPALIKKNKNNWNKFYFRYFGGKQHAQWLKLWLQNSIKAPPANIIWKDPFCTFMVDYLTNIYNMKAVCMVRHPSAHYYSVKKQNWRFNINFLTRQSKLLADYGEGIDPALWKKAENDNLTSIALLWKIMARQLHACNKDNENILLVCHEDLCMDTVVIFRRICSHFEIDFTPKMAKYIQKTTKGSSVDAVDGNVHDFVRNSKALTDSWKSNLKHVEQEAILKVVGKDVKLFYT